MGATANGRFRASSLGLAAALLALPLAGARADDQPVGSATSPDGKVRVEVLSLRRTEGDTVTLRFAVVNNGNADYSVTLGNLRLIDLVGRRWYEAGLSSSGCSTPPGKQLVCWAMFAAPPANTKTIAVRFYEHVDLITGVPITE
jgi:hypothetical protein